MKIQCFFPIASGYFMNSIKNKYFLLKQNPIALMAK